MSAAVNNTGAERTATVTVKTTNNTSKGSVKVTQAPAAATVSVSTAQELRAALYGNNPHNNEYMAKGTIIQMQNDINLEDLGEWTAISVYERSFILDGAGHTLTINAVGSSESYTLHAGLLNWVNKSNITIKNLGVVGRIVADSTFEGLSTAQLRAGSLAAHVSNSQFTVENSYFANVNQGVLASRDYRFSTAKSSAGGFFGEISSYADVKITDCFVNGDVRANTIAGGFRNNPFSYAGGFVGQITGQSNLTISNSYAAGTVTSYTDTTNIGLRTIAASYAGGLIGAKDDNVQYTATSAAYWCNKMIWLNQDEDVKKPYINDFDKEKTFTEMEALPLFNSTYWKESSKSWPILKHMPAGGLLDDVLGLLASLDSSVGHQSLAEVSIQLAGFDVYYADVIENKLMNRGDFDGFEEYDYNLGVLIDICEHAASHIIAHKELSNGKTVVIIAIMGTGTEHDGLDSIGKWISNLSVGYPLDGEAEHIGFREAANSVLEHLMDDDGAANKHGNVVEGYLDRYEIDPSNANVEFLITGHSRGAAVGNLLTVRLFEGYGNNGIKDRVFSYNFAVPYVVNPWFTSIDPCSNDYDNIFNICNEKDIVTHFLPLPGWTRYGKDVIFCGESTPGILFGAHRAELYQKEVYKGLKGFS